MSSSSSAPHPQAQGAWWSDLPELLLLSIVVRLPYLSDILSFAAVCRSWRLFVHSSAANLRHHFLSSSPRPPLLLLPTRPSSPGQGPPYSFHSVEGGGGGPLSTKSSLLVGVKPFLNPDYRGAHTIGLGCSHGHLILHQILEELDFGLPACGVGGDITIRRRLVICDPFTGREIFPPPPPPDHYPSVYISAALSAPPFHDSGCFLILLTLTSVVYCRLGVKGEEHCSDYTVVHPRKLNLKDNPFYPSSILPLSNHRTVYAINFDTDMLLELSVPSINQEPGQRRELGVKIHNLESVGGYWDGDTDWWHFGPQLSELDGDLLLVLFVKSQVRERSTKTQTQLMRIRIHRMVFKEMRWTKAEHVLDDCALFLDPACGRCAVFVPKPEQWGGRRGCVYLADQERNTWREFACHDGLLVPDYPSPPFFLPEQTLPRWPAPLWLYPSFLF